MCHKYSVCIYIRLIYLRSPLSEIFLRRVYSAGIAPMEKKELTPELKQVKEKARSKVLDLLHGPQLTEIVRGSVRESAGTTISAPPALEEESVETSSAGIQEITQPSGTSSGKGVGLSKETKELLHEQKQKENVNRLYAERMSLSLDQRNRLEALFSTQAAQDPEKQPSSAVRKRIETRCYVCKKKAF